MGDPVELLIRGAVRQTQRMFSIASCLTPWNFPHRTFSDTDAASNPSYRSNPRHPNQTVNVGSVDGHVESMPMAGQGSSNGVTNPAHPQYKDQLGNL